MLTIRYDFSKYKWNVTKFFIDGCSKQFLRKNIDCNVVLKSVPGACNAILTGPCHLKFNNILVDIVCGSLFN
jgi:hypothetical protein